jgi:hypothetical protein
MLCPCPTPLNRRPRVPNLPNPHRAPSREAGSFCGHSAPSLSSTFCLFGSHLAFLARERGSTMASRPPPEAARLARP